MTIVAKPGEVGIAFKVANQLIKKGSAIYDDELKIDRNFRESQGGTKVYISLKKRNKKINKEIEINNNNIIDVKKINEESNIIINENTSKEFIDLFNNLLDYREDKRFRLDDIYNSAIFKAKNIIKPQPPLGYSIPVIK